MIGKAIYAGLMVGIGVSANLMLENPILGALLFSLALLVIMQNQLYLYTGKIGYFNFTKEQSKILVLGLLFNFIGCLFAVSMNCGDPTYIAEISRAAALKFEPSAIRLFIEAFFCGILMFTAVNSKKTIITVFCIMTFILLGYEHCVADFPFLYFVLSFENIIKFLLIILGNTIGSIFIHFLVKEKENGKKRL